MDEKPPRVTVHPPGPDRARRVTVSGRNLGVAHRIEDLVRLLRRAGLDVVEVERGIYGRIVTARVRSVIRRGAAPNEESGNESTETRRHHSTTRAAWDPAAG